MELCLQVGGVKAGHEAGEAAAEAMADARRAGLSEEEVQVCVPPSLYIAKGIIKAESARAAA